MPESALEVQHLVKCYDDITAVNDLSFTIRPGEVFGLLGPNGSGKTTTIRMVMDIFKPDSGTVQVLGQAPAASRKQVGYLPEERGLYDDLSAHDVLVYLARLKGMEAAATRQHVRTWLERVELSDRADARVKSLSGGMQQKLQFVASLVHDPDLIILDEPFQGLDPVNITLVESIIRELHAQGKTIVLSSHQLNRVEALCERIVLIHRGRKVLYGPVQDIKRQYSPNAIRVSTDARLDASLPGVERVERRGDDFLLTLNGVSSQDLLATLLRNNVAVRAFEVASLPLEEIFVSVVKGEKDA